MIWQPSTRIVNAQDPIDWNHPINQGLLSDWTIIPQTRGGYVLNDLCGNNHGDLTTYMDAADWVHTPHGDGLDTDNGKLDHVEFRVIPPVDSTTWAAWVMLRAANSYPMIYSTGASGGYHELAYSGSSRKPYVIWNYAASGYGTFVHATAMALNTWHHIACTYDGTTLKLYVDGSYSGEDASTYGTPSFFWSAARGDSGFGTFTLDGQISRGRVYDRPLSKREMHELYLDGLRKQSHLHNYYTPKHYSLVAAPAGGATQKGVFSKPFIGPFGGPV